MNVLKTVSAIAVFAAMAGAAQAADSYVNVSVGGEIKPGVYGRVDIGTSPPPAVYSGVPVIVQQPVIVPGQVVVPAQPVYLHVPPGHRKKWSKHCARYNACGAPVYFVKVDGKGRMVPAPANMKHDDDHDRGHGKGHGHGRGKD